MEKHVSPTTVEPPLRFQQLFRLTERNPQRAVRLAQRLYKHAAPNESAETAWSAFTLGMALVRWEQLDKAAMYLEQAQSQFTNLDMVWPALQVRRAQLAINLIRGGGPELQASWDDLAAAFERNGLALEAARSRFDQIAQLNSRGHPRDALAMIEQIAPIVEHAGSPADTARIARLQALAYRNLGELARAEIEINRAVDHYQALQATPDIAKSLYERAVIYRFAERFTEAIAELTYACDLFDQLALPYWKAYCQQEHGICAFRLGMYAQAIALLVQARTTLEGLGRQDQLANCDLSLGNISYYCGLFDLAFAVYQRAEQVYRQLHQTRMALICQRNQALALRGQNQLERALEQLAPLSTQAQAIGDQLEVAEIELARGVVLRELGRFPEALASVITAEEQFQARGNMPAACECQIEQGWLFLGMGDPALAAACFQKGREGLSDQPSHVWRATYGLASCAEQKGQLDQALAFYRSASATVANMRRPLASEHASSGIFALAQKLFNDALRLAVQLNAGEAALELGEQLRATSLVQQVRTQYFVLPSQLQAEHERLREELRSLIDQPAAGDAATQPVAAYIELLLRARHTQQPTESEAPASLNLAELRQQFSVAFPNGWTVLAFSDTDDGLVTVTVDAAQLQVAAVPLDRQLKRSLKRATQANFRPMVYLDVAHTSGESPVPWGDLAALGERLVPSAVRARLHPGHRLLIIPSSSLQNLAWASLRIGEHWLAEQAVVQLLPSLGLWPALHKRRVAGSKALLLGVQSFHGRAPDLPNVKPSLDVIERVWPHDVTQLEDRAFTRERLQQLSASGDLRRYGHLHLATHGQLLKSAGLLAHLKLRDDDLFYGDIAQLNLGGATVVLAACEGASGETLPGEEVLSLSRAFLGAGARDVLSSCWLIDDATVVPMLDVLYQALARGDDTPTALAKAQRDMIRRYDRINWGGADLKRNEGRTTKVASSEVFIHRGAADPHEIRKMYSPMIWAGFSVVGAGSLAEM